MDKSTPVGVIGAGTMGAGIAQIAATFGHNVTVFDADKKAGTRARAKLDKVLNRLVEKGRLDAEEAAAIAQRIGFVEQTEAFAGAGLVVEAVVEDLTIKRRVFESLEKIVANNCVLATNTSSLSVASIASACANASRVLGVHFFNPAPLMPLVEIVPGVATAPDVAANTRSLIDAWGKATVLAKDTPGFIVNRVARPFYGEALRILEEGIADAATIDWALKHAGFRMGPFELMDFIGNDVNYTVTETVFEAFFYDPRYRPSFTQKRLVEAGRLGRKSEHGFYDYAEGAQPPSASEDEDLGHAILTRVLVMLINEAADALFWGVASRDDIDAAMTKGVNYPKGLLAWADEIGLGEVLARLEALQQEYGEDSLPPEPVAAPHGA